MLACREPARRRPPGRRARGRRATARAGGEPRLEDVPLVERRLVAAVTAKLPLGQRDEVASGTYSSSRPESGAVAAGVGGDDQILAVDQAAAAGQHAAQRGQGRGVVERPVPRPPAPRSARPRYRSPRRTCRRGRGHRGLEARRLPDPGPPPSRASTGDSSSRSTPMPVDPAAASTRSRSSARPQPRSSTVVGLPGQEHDQSVGALLRQRGQEGQVVVERREGRHGASIAYGVRPRQPITFVLHPRCTGAAPQAEDPVHGPGPPCLRGPSRC